MEEHDRLTSDRRSRAVTPTRRRLPTKVCLALITAAAALVVAVQPAAAVSPSPGTIATLAGGGPADGSFAAKVAVEPCGVAIGGQGVRFFSDCAGDTVYRIDTSRTLTRVAGDGFNGFAGDGGRATEARLSHPAGLAVDAAGNLYVTDVSNNRIRKVTPAGIITTVAGDGTYGFSGDGGPATNAHLASPTDVTVDSAGNLYIADEGNERVRKVASNGTITTVAGVGSFGMSGDGGPATRAELHTPYGVAAGPAGDLYIADLGNHRVRKVTTSGTISTVAGNGTSGFSGDGGPATSASVGASDVAVDAAGTLFILDYMRVRQVTPAGTISTVAGTGTFGFSGDGGPANSAQLGAPQAVAADAAGGPVIADTGNVRLRKVFGDGTINTIAGNGYTYYSGDGGPAERAQLNDPRAVAMDATGATYIADASNNRVRRVAADGTISTFAGMGVAGFAGDGGPATKAWLAKPSGVVVGRGGSVYIADTTNNRVRVVGPGGTITTVAGDGSTGFSGDGGPATAARLNRPTGLALDAAGNLFIADTANQRVRMVTNAGTITTVAGTDVQGYSGDGGPAVSARLSNPSALAIDGRGRVYIADWLNRRVRRIGTDGSITTVAGTGSLASSGDGGPATAAEIGDPLGVALDAAGNLYIADGRNSRIRKVDPDGTISTAAGDGTIGARGDGGPATSAQLAFPSAVAVGPSGELLVSDTLARRIRVVGGPARPAPAPKPGYWLTASDGGVFGYGASGFHGSTGGTTLARPVVGMAATPSGLGYWLGASDGGIFAFGDAGFFGSTGGMVLNRPVVGMAATPSGRGYWLVASDGGIFAFGDAGFFGSTGGMVLNRPVVGMAATPSGRGYWLVASDGGIFAFGDARFDGSTGGMPLNAPIVAMAATPTGAGYRLVATDGGIFAFGDAGFHGSTGDTPLARPVVGLATTASGAGYWLVAGDGGVFSFGDAPFLGSPAGLPLERPVVAIAAATR
jgi:sugar lactone lactonase YvrE